MGTELIDCWFFTTECSLWYETHYLLTLTDFNFDSKNIYNFLTTDMTTTFNSQLSIMLKQEAAHLTTWFYENKSKIKGQYSYVDAILKANRECLRQVKWKDWSDFTENQYDSVRFGNMFKANRDLYIPILNMLYNTLNNYAIDVLGIKDYDQEHHLSQMFKVIYALYMVKADENERRQINDKRYNKNVVEGQIVGKEI